jgi:CBS domain containing-hemolysin-like protein
MWQVILPWLAPMLALILLSAFFSGSEAALFSLGTRDRKALARGPIGGRVAVGLLEDAERLLSAVLFWNLLINMTYFAIASIVGAKLEASGPAAMAAFTIGSLVSIIFFSEMLPKSIAVLSPRRFSRYAGPPLAVAVRLLAPVLPAVRFFNTLARRLLWPSFQPERDLEVSDIERAIEMGTGDAALAERERAALRQLVQLATTRVDEWMLPRNFLRLQRAPVTREAIVGGVPAHGYVLIAEPESDDIIAAIAVRTLRPSQLDDLVAATEPVLYVPWSATVADTFDSLQANDRHVAAVVNEFGETVGVLTVEMILEGILRLQSGRPSEAGDEVQFEQLEEGRWQVGGLASARWVAEQIGAEPPEGRNVTVAGLMQQVNERFPREGDRCRWGKFELQVIASDWSVAEAADLEPGGSASEAVSSDGRQPLRIEIRALDDEELAS